MLRRYPLLLLALLHAVFVLATDIAGTDYSIDTLQMFSPGPGSEYMSVRMRRTSDRQGRLDVHILRVDTRNPYVTTECVLGKDAVVGTERPSAMAKRKSTDTRIFYGGVNGDFFATTGDVGRPTGLTIVNNEFAYTPSSSSRRLGAVDATGAGHIASGFKLSAQLIMADTTLHISHFNYTRKEDELVLYNRHNGTSTGTNGFGTELLVTPLDGERWHTTGSVRLRVISKASGTGDMSIGEGQAVLSGHGIMQAELDRIAAGDTLTLNMRLRLDNTDADISQCIGADNYNLIVDDGETVTTNYWDELHPRTAFGQSSTADTLLFCVVDGRGQSVGCNTRVLGAIMRHYGAWRAVNWDGGGSSSMFIRHFGNQVNHGSDGAERAVGNAMFVVAEVPEEDNTIAEIRSYSPVLHLPRHGVVTPRFLGYNRYGVLIDPNLKGVTLTCDTATGTIRGGNTFVCNNGGTLQMHYGGVTGSIEVHVSDNAELALRLNNVIVSDDSDYPIEVVGTVGNSNITLLPAALDWTVENPDIASVSADGLLNGIANGSTRVFGSLGNYKDTLEVTVEIPESKPLLWDNMVAFDTRSDMYPSSEWGTIFNTSNEGKSILHINYQTPGRQPVIEFESALRLYSTPRYIELRCPPSDFPVEKIAFGIHAANAAEEVSTEPVAVNPGEGFSVIIDIDSLLDVNRDFAVFPVKLTYLALYLSTTAAKKEYDLTFDGIYLHYSTSTLPSDSDALPKVTMDDKNITTKTVRNGQVVIVRDGQYFSLLGIPLQ